MSRKNFLGAIARSVLLAAVCVFSLMGAEANWTGPSQPCMNAAEIKKHGHMNIGVRFEIQDAIVIDQFHRAFNFWETVLDARFYDDESPECSIAVVPATSAILGDHLTIARAQLPDRLNFNGSIAIDPDASKRLSDDEALATWIHEIGHVLGLKHNPDPRSLMYYLDVDGSSKLDEADLSALAALHQLRSKPSQAIQEQAYARPPITNSRHRVVASDSFH